MKEDDLNTHQKKVFPATLFRRRSSRRVGRSVSTPSSPSCLWCSRWYFYKPLSRVIVGERGITCLEGGSVRDGDWEVCKHGKKLVGLDAPESEVVGNFMDC